MSNRRRRRSVVYQLMWVDERGRQRRELCRGRRKLQDRVGQLRDRFLLSTNFEFSFQAVE